MHKQALAKEGNPGLPLPGVRSSAGRRAQSLTTAFGKRWSPVGSCTLTPGHSPRGEGHAVSPSLEKDHEPPHRGTESVHNLYMLQFWVLLSKLLLVWVVTLKQASPNTH